MHLQQLIIGQTGQSKNKIKPAIDINYFSIVSTWLEYVCTESKKVFIADSLSKAIITQQVLGSVKFEIILYVFLK